MSRKNEKPIDEIVERSRQTAEDIVDKAVEPVRSLAESAASGFSRFSETQGASGFVLLAAAALALLVSNTPLVASYNHFFDTPLSFTLGPIQIEKALLLWINDGLMAIFFFLIGLEIKREFIQGRLRYPSQVALPFFGALGGMIVPAGIFAAVTYGHPDLLGGIAIPTATDIAFALAIISLLEHRVPIGLKVFLLSVAIFDDIGAIIIIAIFYGEPLSLPMLWTALGLFAILLVLNLSGVRLISIYAAVGILLWVAVLKSGVHATIAGVLVALTVPILEKDGDSPLERAEQWLNPWVAFGIMPIFAFANAGIPLEQISASMWLQPLTLAIIAGLVVGKPAGILAAVFFLTRMHRVELPEQTTWSMLASVSALAGIGFTMSLFIGTLAFEYGLYATEVRMGILSASAASAIVGYIAILFSTRSL